MLKSIVDIIYKPLQILKLFFKKNNMILAFFSVFNLLICKGFTCFAISYIQKY